MRDRPETHDAATLLLGLWRLTRPETWMVSLLPTYVGHVLATRQIVPGLPEWAAFWADASLHGATFEDIGRVLAATGPDLLRFAAAFVVMGPLLWTATLLVNDVHDLPGDRTNPRKARSPLVQGVVSRGLAQGVARFAAAAAIALGLAVGPAFALLTAACLALAWAYSVPPLRLKTRPGADVFVNAIGVGALAGLAGWSITADPVRFPFAFLAQGVLTATAVYVPTTLVDLEADRAAGYHTLATHLGPKRAYAIGWWAWVAANAGALILSWNDRVIPRTMLPLLLLFAPLLLWEYHSFIGQAREGPDRIRGIVLCALTFAAVNAVFVLVYTGLWR